MTAAEPRPVNMLLMTGLITAPLVFFWFLLLPGYAHSTRIAAATYMLLPLALTLIVALGQTALSAW